MLMTKAMAAERAAKPLAASAMMARRKGIDVGTTSPKPRVVSAAPLTYTASAKPWALKGVDGS